MTGYISKHFRHSCTESGCYVESLPSWDDLIECFPRGIRPTDVDGMVEINGHVLLLEEKQQGKGLEEGQRRALRALSRRPGITVAFFRPGASSELEVLILDRQTATGWQPFTREEFGFWLQHWSAQADAYPHDGAAT